MRESVKKNQERIKQLRKIRESCKNSDEALDYLDQHSADPFGRIVYGKALLHEGNRKEAKEVFEELLELGNFKHVLKYLSFFELVEKDYINCLKHINIIEELFKEYYDKRDFRYIKYLCMSQLGMQPDINNNSMDYIEYLIFNYNREMVIKHISNHLIEFHEQKSGILGFDEKDFDDALFAKDTDIEKLYDEMMDILKLDEVKDITDYAVCTKIYFKYDNIGINTNGKQNYLVVMILTGTDHIISMYPTISPERNYLINKNPVFDFQETLKKAREQRAL